MTVDRCLVSKLLMAVAVVLFVLTALYTGGVFAVSAVWLLPSGLAAAALSLLAAP